MARWDGDSLTLWDANQGPHNIVPDLRKGFGLEADQVRVISPYVGGAFGVEGVHPPEPDAGRDGRPRGAAGPWCSS